MSDVRTEDGGRRRQGGRQTQWQTGSTAASLLSAPETGFPPHKSHRNTRRVQCRQDKAGLALSSGSSAAVSAYCAGPRAAEYGRCLSDVDAAQRGENVAAKRSDLCREPHSYICQLNGMNTGGCNVFTFVCLPVGAQMADPWLWPIHSNYGLQIWLACSRTVLGQ